ALERRFLLDYRGKNERLVGRVEWQILAACLPGGGETALHAVVSEGQDHDIGCIGREAIGVRKELTFRVHARMPESGHHLRGTLAGNGVCDGGMLRERLQEFPER